MVEEEEQGEFPQTMGSLGRIQAIGINRWFSHPHSRIKASRSN
jgi:hypothetical protein